MTGALFFLLLAQTAHQHHPPQSAAEYAKVLNDPARDAWQKPHDVIMALRLKPTDAVADLGAGTGYFARRIAMHAGKVYAVDIDADLLKIAAQGAPKNLETVVSTADDPKLADASVDLIFICDVLHHIENRPAYFAKLAKALKPGGRIVNIDFFKKQLPVGPPPEMKLSEEQVIEEFTSAGFQSAGSQNFLPYQYFLIFRKK